MKDIIEREQILKLINNDISKRTDLSSEIITYLFGDLRHRVWAIPSCNNFGAWVDNGYREMCSVCHWEMNSELPWILKDLEDNNNRPKYCPKCGARLFFIADNDCKED